MVEKPSRKKSVWRVASTGSVLTVVALALSACGQNSIDQGKAQDFVKKNLGTLQQAELGPASKPEKISCPSDVEVRRGKTFSCAVAYQDGYKAAVTIHMKDEKGNIEAAPKDFVVKSKSAQIADKGNFLLNVKAGQGSEAGFEDAISQEAVAQLVKDLNSLIALPRNVPINFASGLEGPAYDPNTHQIDMPYSFAADTYNLFDSTGRYSQEEGVTNVNEVLKYVLLHEATHALIHELDLPVVGREEDAADGLAATLLAEEGDEGANTALTAAEFWDLSAASNGDLSVESFADEHGLDKQRFFNIVCLVYGSNPEKYAGLVGEYLPQGRAERCPGEFIQSQNSWAKLLKPYIQQK